MATVSVKSRVEEGAGPASVVLIERSNGEVLKLTFGEVCVASRVLREHILRMLPKENLPAHLVEEALQIRERSASFTRPTEQEKQCARELLDGHVLDEKTLAQALADARVRTVRG